jgi:NADPH-dependent glutamate synthase beta subunit-like oxidoreductase
LAVARDLAVAGYQVTIFDNAKAGGGMMRSQIPKFRLPEEVIDEEVDYILGLGVELRNNHWVNSLKEVLAEDWDAIFVGTGAPRGRDADVPGRQEAGAHIHVGIEWLSSVAFGHVKSISPRVIVLGGGLALLGEALRERVAGALPPLLMDAFRPGPTVRLAELMEDAVLAGSFAVAAQRLP